jgi:hypothetical protein
MVQLLLHASELRGLELRAPFVSALLMVVDYASHCFLPYYNSSFFFSFFFGEVLKLQISPPGMCSYRILLTSYSVIAVNYYK